MSHCPHCRSTNNTPTAQPPTIRIGDHADAAGNLHTHVELRFVVCDDCDQRFIVRRSFTPTRRQPEQATEPTATQATVETPTTQATADTPTPKPPTKTKRQPKRQPKRQAQATA